MSFTMKIFNFLGGYILGMLTGGISFFVGMKYRFVYYPHESNIHWPDLVALGMVLSFFIIMGQILSKKP